VANQAIWFEVMGKDSDVLRKFYRDQFGWSITDRSPVNKLDYGLVDAVEDGVRGGIGASPLPGSLFATFMVDVSNPKTILERVTELGGKAIVPLDAVPGLDMEKAYIADPEGNVVCITHGLAAGA
jgi:predicted enzyme related to lactoylglutathione lyase